MTIYDAVTVTLSLYPNIPKPNYIKQYTWFDDAVFDNAVRYLPVELFDGDSYTIVRKDCMNKTIVIISTNDMKLLNPGKHKQFKLHSTGVGALWNMIQKETAFNTVKTQAIQRLEKFHTMWQEELLYVHSLDFYDNFINIINGTQMRLGESTCKRRLEAFCDRLNAFEDEDSSNEEVSK